jgi:hypothetical protein
MANQPKVIKLDLEQIVLDARGRGLSLDRIRDECNSELERRGDADRLSKPAVERYLRSLDAASVPAAHHPELAEESARLAIDFAGRLTRLDELLGEWLEQANEAVTPMRGVLWDPYSQEPLPTKAAQDRHGDELDRLHDALDYMDGDAAGALRDWIAPVDVLVPDWMARTRVAKELRQMLELYANVMGRIYDAQQVQDFQRAVLAAIEAADPHVARQVVEHLHKLQDARKAALFGAAA